MSIGTRRVEEKRFCMEDTHTISRILAFIYLLEATERVRREGTKME